MTRRVVFVRVGWMQFYGLRPEDSGPIGGGAFNRSDRGSEVENFKDRNGTCYGYAQVSRLGAGFNLDRVAGQPIDGEKLSDVLVVSVATRPSGRQVVVGWHSSATIYRKSYDRPRGGYNGYNFAAPARGAVLLHEGTRCWRIPKGADGMGQANVCYARDIDGRRRRDPWIARVLNLIKRYRGNRRGEPDDALEAREGERFRIETLRFVRDPEVARTCIARDRYRCRHCGFALDQRHFLRGTNGISNILHAHHVRPLADGKRNTRVEDLVTLCPTCHAVAHAIARAMDADAVTLALLRRHYRPTSR